MKYFSILLLVTSLLPSCVEQQEKRPVGPVSESSRLPWNLPQKGQGAGQLGMLPQNQHRR